MSETIGKSAVCEILADMYPTDGEKVVDVKQIDKAYEAIQQLPSAQPIIRCKDCTHYDAGFECLIEGYGIVRDQDWYCADAERRTDGSDRETGGD